MQHGKRPRGRPKGTTLDDRPVLMRIAEVMVENPGTRPTTALRRIHRRAGPSEVRRIQVKWKAVGEQLMEEVRARTDDANGRRSSVASYGSYREANRLTRLVEGSQALRALREWNDSPTMRAIRAVQDSPTMRAIRAVEDSPTMRAINAAQESPTMKAIRDVYDGPMMKAARAFQDSPLHRAALGFAESPTMRLIRQEQDRISRLARGI